MHDPHHLLRVTLESVRDAVVAADGHLRVRWLNPAAESLTGWSSADATGRQVDEVLELRAVGTDLPEPVGALIAMGNRQDSRASEPVLLLSRDGRRVAVELSVTPLREPQSEENTDQTADCLLVLHDVSEAVQLADHLAYQAQYDTLTGLPKRILLVDRLEQAARFADRNNDQLAIVFLTAKPPAANAKAVDAVIADSTIREIAFRLTAVLRESDTVCRLGGAEFVLLLSGLPSVGMMPGLAAKLIAEVTRPYDALSEKLVPRCSLGISLYPRDASDPATLMRLADGAMQRAMRLGGSRAVFAGREPEPEMTADQAHAAFVERAGEL
jgi:diguanylate cyclase (GGDEF)-like protein/PAS domain S-box-containing protein